MEAICALLGREEVALLTLTGAGGVGKTRLALTVAERLQAEFDDGVFFVPLASISDPELVAIAIIQALPLRPQAGRAPEEMLREFVQSRRLLLVLDNFEQVLPAAPLVAALLAAAPSLVVLVTSRAVLHLYGEHDFLLAPLALPDTEALPPMEQLEKVAAIQLFVERAKATKHDFVLTPDNASAVAAICARLDGLPLAIELAAARTRLLSPQAMLGRLEHRLLLLTGGPRDQPIRQQTMRETIAWSHNLLDDDSKRLFRQVSIFVGGWTLEAAEQICDAGIDVVEGFSTLVDHNLLRQIEEPDGSPRFGMLETIREFGLDQLDERDEARDTRRRHAKYFLELAEQAGPQLIQSEQVQWLTLLETEHDNLRAALSWATEQDIDLALRAAKGLLPFWLFHGHLTEARRWLEGTLSTGNPTSELVRAEALNTAASLASWQGDFGRAAVLFQEGLTMFKSAGDQYGIADTLRALGRMEMAAGNHQRADLLGLESAAIFRRLGHPNGLMFAIGNVGWNAIGLGELDRSRTLLDEALILAQSQDNHAMVANYLTGLAFVTLDRGEIEKARQQFLQTLQLSRDVGDLRFVAMSFEGLGRVARHQGMQEHACMFYGAAHAVRERIGMRAVEDFLHPQFESDLNDTRSRLGHNNYDALWREALQMSLEEATKYALDTALFDASVQQPSSPAGSLSPRELEVLRLIAEGKTDREIAADLFISPHTVMRHVSHILNKLGLESRTAAAAHAIRHHLV